LPALTEQDQADFDAMQAAIDTPLPPDTRVWDALWGAHAVPPKPTEQQEPDVAAPQPRARKSSPKRTKPSTR
jgi:hypothetical protein